MHPDIDLSTADRDVFISIIARQQAIIEGLRKRVAQLAGRIWPNGSREIPSLNPNNSFMWVHLRTRDFRLLNGSTHERHGLGGVAAQGGGNIGFTGQHGEDDGPATQGLYDLSGGPSSHLRAVFIQSNIPYPVAAVFRYPIVPAKGRGGYAGWPAGAAGWYLHRPNSRRVFPPMVAMRSKRHTWARRGQSVQPTSRSATHVIAGAKMTR